MIIKSVALHNFRNYESLDLSLGNNLNILYGDNAQGKTNVLEAIYVCGTTKSHKGSKDKDIIKLGCEDAHIRMIVEKDNIEHKIDMHLKKNKSKGIAIDGVPIKRSGDVFGLIYIVFFSPEDLNMIKEGPGERRRFLDMELSQMDKVYLYHLTKFNKILAQRNNLLKQIGIDRTLIDTLDIWDKQLIENGKVLIRSRAQFIESINEIIKPIHSRLTGNIENIKLIYEPNVTEEEFEKKVVKSRDRDIYQKMTLTGPHRDDICFLINDNDIRKFGSQGQQRTAALSLKLSEIELVKKTIKDNPILLLDDVLSELDRKRQNYLMDSINDIQTLITCTGLEELVEKKKEVSRLYHIVNGNID